ncbi:hypothetical protein B0A49_02153 [Cryomyces minteri]|uniref:Phospholipase n=1 Tax=Cryomyces minteri TaxID=331657 RepID=A0A4U0X904_9PEZI|nr:hypothetical protein B0A49_02153 [Cryomyces minteri]
MAQRHADEQLAYGEYYHEPGVGQDSERGLFGDISARLLGRHNLPDNSSSDYQPTESQPYPPQASSSMSFLFDKMHSTVHKIGAELKEKITGEGEVHGHTHESGQCSDGTHSNTQHRFLSFAPQREGNETKWYVDGCGSLGTLERSGSQKLNYLIDRMLQAAAERGVKVNVIVYKEVAQALTHPMTRALTRFGLDIAFKSLEEVEKTNPLIEPPVPVSSVHTKHALEKLHPNISVFRHPDHLPDRQTLQSSFLSSLQGMKLSATATSKLPGDALQAIYGMNEDTVLFWAHHEKLCLIDGRIAFMGGLDLCYGRWDTNQHSIADAHPTDLNETIFPGQDYNNARIMDFQDVSNWQNNKLDRTVSSRMGWSDLSICLSGPVVEDLRAHFVERWNFIYNEKYDVRKDVRKALAPPIPQIYSSNMETTGVQKANIITLAVVDEASSWSHGVPIEHSIANAYIKTIRESKHFVYIENQFFITATSDRQRPIKNKIGAAITERIIRAARNREQYMVFVMMPAIPAFAGDLQSDDALSTRCIMEFQYNSINRGGHSIMETIAREGIDPMDYIRFYNLRSYDRINSSGTMREAEQRSGVAYDDARQGYDAKFGAEIGASGGYASNVSQSQPYGQPSYGAQEGRYEQYQAATQQVGDRHGQNWDTVASCYMLGGTDIRNVPWEDGQMAEIDAFVSEELYIHSKLLIADDQTVICGSANLNDRSQLGDHDSEIAIVIEDPTPVDSFMAGRPWTASRFAASLRRQLFRKHLGLLPPQDAERPTANFHPIGVPNVYDFNTPEDTAVVDPLSPAFQTLWNKTARTNTDAFTRVFHPVPYDGVRNWKEYDEYYERFFKVKDPKRPSTYKWGHVVREAFSPGERGLWEVKEELARIKGTLVEMPLLFLKDEDIAKEGLGLNAFTEEVYT